MAFIREKKIRAAFDKLDSALDRVAAIPRHELTFEERWTLWAQLETLRVALANAAQRCQHAAS
jgi:hypothetical protein